MTSALPVDLAGRRVLVVEDQFLIALDMEVLLRALGARRIDLVAGIPEALTAIERTPPDLVILDWKLGTTTTVSVANALQARAIPFVIVTGYDDLSILPEGLRRVPFIRKPVPLETLRATLAAFAL